MRRAPRTATALVVAGVLAGCVARPGPAPTASGVSSGSQALRRLAERDAETQTLTATFKLVLRRADGTTETSRGAVVVARPDRLRLQVFAFGVATAYDYTVDGDRFRMRRPLEGVEKIGRFGQPGEEDGFGDELRPLFLHAARIESAGVIDVGDRYRVHIPEGEGARDVDVIKADGRVEREALSKGGKPIAEIEYDDDRPVDGVSMPFLVQVSYPSRGVSLRIEIERYTRNQPVDSQVFAF